MDGIKARLEMIKISGSKVKEIRKKYYAILNGRIPKR